MVQLLTVKEVAERLNIKPRTVRDWLHDGKIPGTVLPDGSLRFSEQSVLAWINERTTKSRKP